MCDIVLPRLGWSMEHGVFLGWLKRAGEHVHAGEPLFAVEGDKAVQDIEAMESGVVRIAADGPKPGDTIPVGAVLGRIEQLGHVSQPPAVPTRASPSARRRARELGVDVTSSAGTSPGGRIQEEELRSPHARTSSSVEGSRRQAITPRARKAARERNVDAAQLQGTGRNGRIRERDILAASSATTRASAPPGVEESQTQRPTSFRRTIAQRLVHSLRTTAPVTLTTTVDATNLVNLRNQFKALADATAMTVPSFTDFVIKLTALALRQHPHLNACWHEDHIETKTDIHIGVAVDTEAGLLVPVVRDVPTRTMRQLATLTRALIEKAQSRGITPEEMRDGTFTVTNLGCYGIDAFTPIINWPQCAILGIGAIRQQPLVVDNQIVVRHAVTLSLTFDHRAVDGAPAARFLETLGKGVANPSAWLVE